MNIKIKQGVWVKPCMNLDETGLGWSTGQSRGWVPVLTPAEMQGVPSRTRMLCGGLGSPWEGCRPPFVSLVEFACGSLMEMGWEKLWQNLPMEAACSPAPPQPCPGGQSTWAPPLCELCSKIPKHPICGGDLFLNSFFSLGFPSKLSGVRKPSVNWSFCSLHGSSLSPCTELLSGSHAASSRWHGRVGGVTEPLSSP